MKTIVYPAHGWLPSGAYYSPQRHDQGEDGVTNWRGVLQAPGDGYCTRIGSDRPFPNGFGPSYPYVMITSGPFARNGQPTEYYIGHTTSLVRTGEHFGFGHPITRADQGRPSQIGIHLPNNGGWFELGPAPGGSPGPMQSTPHWFYPLLVQPLKVSVPESSLRYGMKGLRILGLSSSLRDCGYLKRPYWHFDSHVHGAVVAFKTLHHLPMPPIAKDPKKQQDRGVVDDRTAVAIRHAAAWCKKHHTHEYPPHKK